MKTIALRFANNYAPSEGTIKLHNDVINTLGYVWYRKFGNSLFQKNIILSNTSKYSMSPYFVINYEEGENE